MRMRFLSPKNHSLLDYSLSGAMIMFPLLLNLGTQSQAALWLLIIAGIFHAAYSAATDYPCGVSPVISYRAHLLIDAGMSMLLMSAPCVFGFPMVATVYYFVIGGLGLLLATVSRPIEEGECLDCVARP